MNIKDEIASKIIKALEDGVIPWKCPFEQCSLPTNYKTKKAYNGLNTLVLWLYSTINNYTSNYWIGFNQAKTLGGKVKKGEKATNIIACMVKNQDDIESEGEQRPLTFFRSENVFNLDQIENLKMATENDLIKPLSELDTLIDRHKVIIKHQGEKAFYSPTNEFINMPYKSKFKDTSGYYSTLLHELIHWTGHKSRLNRLDIKSKADRGLEELVAEIGASFLCAEYGIPQNLTNTSSYVASWLTTLQNDHKFIFTAIREANSAIKYLKKFM